MKIIGVTITAFADVSAAGLRRAASLVEVHTDDDVTGAGICWGDERKTVSHLAERLLGQDARAVIGLREALLEAASLDGNPGHLNSAISILDVALWDLKAKNEGLPLWKSLGGCRPNLNAHAAGFGLTESDVALSERCADLVERFGFRAAKLEMGGDLHADHRRLSLIQLALEKGTSRPDLIIDAHGRWSAEDSIRAVREMEKHFDLTWIEAPAADGDFAGLKRVSNSVRAAVCSGTALAATDFLPHFQHRSLDLIEVSLGACGISGALEVADCAFGYEIPVVLAHSPGNVAAHLSGTLPYAMSLEVVDPHPSGIFRSDIQIVAGRAVAGDEAGLGLTIDRSALASAAIGAASLGGGRSGT